MPHFLVASFAIAGLAAAAGPVIIHLLNRRRYKVVAWAAMDFLREALRRNRRILHLRDLLLLLLRTACVLLFGLAMARPYFSSADSAASPDQPVHAIVVLDNSLSMSYQRLQGSLLDEAKAKARDFVSQLPTGSMTTIVPSCVREGDYSLDPYRTREDMIEAIDAVAIVDRVAAMTQVVELAQQAARRVVELPTKRVVVFGDQQFVNWPSAWGDDAQQTLTDVQLVHIAADRPENAWIAEVRIPDGLADVETTTQIVAIVRYEGFEPRTNVPVTLSVDGVVAQTRVVDLEPGQAREVVFTHRFDVAVEPGRAVDVPFRVHLPPDRLPGDDHATRVAPIVAAMPVVFVDEHGPDEKPEQNVFGETFPWRRLMAPITQRDEAARQLIAVRHVKIDQLDQALLADVRLVIVAGVEQPAAAVDVLRAFVEQGGRVVVAAGGRFDPVAWNAQAFRDGMGILPLPLSGQLRGFTPEEAPERVEAFQLDARSLVHDYFVLEQTTDDQRRDLYQAPGVLFFKSVSIDDRPEAWTKMAAFERQRLERRRAPAPTTASQEMTPAPIEPPKWLTWPEPSVEPELSLDDAVLRTQPRVLARYTNGTPYLVERDVGRGRIVFCASGVRQEWNTLMSTHAALVFDRMFRMLIHETLPRRNLATGEVLNWPIAARERAWRFALERPDGVEEPLWVDAQGGDRFGLALRHFQTRGRYRLIAQRPDMPSGERAWEVVLAAQGEPRESELRSLTSARFTERYADLPWRWVARDEALGQGSATQYGHDVWRWLMLAVLMGVLAELLVLGLTRRASLALAGGGA